MEREAPWPLAEIQDHGRLSFRFDLATWQKDGVGLLRPLKTCWQLPRPLSREDGGAGFPGFDCLCADFELQFALAVSRALERKEIALLLVAYLGTFTTGIAAQAGMTHTLLRTGKWSLSSGLKVSVTNIPAGDTSSTAGGGTVVGRGRGHASPRGSGESASGRAQRVGRRQRPIRRT